ncbi:MAG TPA: redoxin domain-containing protein [Gammaproteobacteria bacterium]|nr:redoxin domain-containing protein [Gammaproteobacteria bacterium]
MVIKQTFMILIFSFCLFQGSVSAASAATGVEQLSEGMVNPGFHNKPDWFKLSLMELQDDVTEAAKEGKRVILFFYQDGCPYCAKLLKDNFTDKNIVRKIRKNFDVIAINMWGDKEITDLQGRETIEKDFAEQMKVMYTPTLLFLDEKGKVALRINGYYYPEKFSSVLDYVSGKMESRLNFLQYYKQTSRKKSSAKLHIEASYLQPPYDLADTLKKNKRPLLVLFEQKNCRLCDELHLDILKKKEAMEALRAFDVVLLDQHSKGFLITPRGKRMRIADWARKIKIQHMPSMVFFDVNGSEVFRAEAYLRTFHVVGAMTYVSSGSYKTQPNFQRYLQGVSSEMAKKGIKVDLMK